MKHYFLVMILLFSVEAAGEELVYKFDWTFINIAELSININEFLIIDKERTESNEKFLNLFPKNPVTNTNIKITTKGPLKLIRNYQSNINVRMEGNDKWSYHLVGIDRGQQEEKLIDYSSSSYPVVKKFIDDEGVESLEVNDVKDFQSI